MECTNLGARRPRGAWRSLDARGLRGLQFQDEVLHVWGEKLQCKAIRDYRSDLGDRRQVTTQDTDLLRSPVPKTGASLTPQWVSQEDDLPGHQCLFAHLLLSRTWLEWITEL